MIDVLIPAYNCSQTLKRTLYSLLSQLDNQFSVLVCDDCSTENIENIINDFQGLLNIRYIKNNINLGVAMTRQVLIDNSFNEWFIFLDSDDVFLPQTISVFNTMIKLKGTQADIIVSDFYQEKTSSQGNIGYLLMDRKINSTWTHGKLYNRNFINKHNIRNNENIKYSEDTYFNSICFELGRNIYLPIATCIWTENKNSITRDKQSNYKKIGLYEHINAIYESLIFILQYKNKADIHYINKYSIPSIDNIYSNIVKYPEEEQKRITDKYNEIKALLSK